MAIKYQFNKIAMQNIRKQLKIRQSALPTLKSKEAALRVTVKKQKEALQKLEKDYKSKLLSLNSMKRLWGEFPVDVFNLREVLLHIRKIAGVKTPELNRIDYSIKNYSKFEKSIWLISGVKILSEITEILTNIEISKKKLEILEYARKKTTQKVNLYEKVQIPEFTEALRKIKRYLEDVDNLEKAAQKITKQKQMA